jgi:hypothetical protein
MQFCGAYNHLKEWQPRSGNQLRVCERIAGCRSRLRSPTGRCRTSRIMSPKPSAVLLRNIERTEGPWAETRRQLCNRDLEHPAHPVLQPHR